MNYCLSLAFRSSRVLIMTNHKHVHPVHTHSVGMFGRVPDGHCSLTGAGQVRHDAGSSIGYYHSVSHVGQSTTEGQASSMDVGQSTSGNCLRSFDSNALCTGNLPNIEHMFSQMFRIGQKG